MREVGSCPMVITDETCYMFSNINIWYAEGGILK